MKNVVQKNFQDPVKADKSSSAAHVQTVQGGRRFGSSEEHHALDLFFFPVTQQTGTRSYNKAGRDKKGQSGTRRVTKLDYKI